jgi:hypothetical protein
MFLGFSKAISAEGMFVETREELPKGSDLIVRFRLSDSNDESVIETGAVVVYTLEKAGVGIKFRALPDLDRVRLEALTTGARAASPRPVMLPRAEPAFAVA